MQNKLQGPSSKSKAQFFIMFKNPQICTLITLATVAGSALVWIHTKAPATRTCIFLRKRLFQCALAFCTHVNCILGHWKQSFWTTPVRVEIFRNAIFSVYIWMGRSGGLEMITHTLAFISVCSIVCKWVMISEYFVCWLNECYIVRRYIWKDTNWRLTVGLWFLWWLAVPSVLSVVAEDTSEY